MVSINGGLLALIIFLGICACGLALFGISNIRSGLRGDSREHIMNASTVWHKQPKVLFGINNIVFALILVFVLLLTLLANQKVVSIVIGLIMFTLVVSIVLVVLTMRAGLGALQNMSGQQRQEENESENNEKE
jgi:hypothetical protein